MLTRSCCVFGALAISAGLACAHARDEAASGASRQPGGLTSGIELVLVKGGCYAMGAPDDDCDATPEERPVHDVCVRDFLVGKHEVTRAQWRSVMGRDAPGGSCADDRCPATNVSWDEVQEFLARLDASAGRHFRLPTEAEWEYAARSGGLSERFSGGSEQPGRLAWHADNSGGANHPVGTRAPNGLGIHDMSGSVWELTGDWYDAEFYPTSPRDNPGGPRAGDDHAVRGGSWSTRLPSIRTTRRAALGDRTNGSGRADDVGFRVVATP